MKRIVSLVLVCFLGVGTLCMVDILFPNLPNIILPEIAHHNTIGELPFVEAMDDGDFFEMDGDEDLTAYNCSNKAWGKCRKYCEDYLPKDLFCTSRCALPRLDYCDRLQDKQLRASATAGNFTAKWMVFMQDKCGSWACMGDEDKRRKYENEWKQEVNEEWDDKMTWLGNQGVFKKGYMNDIIILPQDVSN